MKKTCSSPSHLELTETADVLTKITTKLSKVILTTPTNQTQSPNNTTLQNNLLVNSTEDSPSLGEGAQDLNSTVVLKEAPNDPGSSSTGKAFSKLQGSTPKTKKDVEPFVLIDLPLSNVTTNKLLTHPTSSDLANKNSSSGEGTFIQASSLGGVKQLLATENSTESDGSTDNHNTTVADSSDVTPTPEPTGEVSQPASTDVVEQPVNTTSTSSETTQSPVSIAELLQIIQTLLSMINGTTPNSTDALGNITSQLGNVNLTIPSSEAQLPNTTAIENNGSDINASDNSSSIDVNVQGINQTVVVEEPTSDPSSNSTGKD
ncbi:hypothetical protein DFH28DRAFT_1110924 [Melampsora americana]|nr:hypothetical protein DFH28DRAFT_1110924 [Melampsora americana]